MRFGNFELRYAENVRGHQENICIHSHIRVRIEKYERE